MCLKELLEVDFDLMVIYNVLCLNKQIYAMEIKGEEKLFAGRN